VTDTKVEVRGIKELVKALQQVDEQTKSRVKEGMKAIAEDVASAARAKVPFLSGRAKASIKPRGTARGAGIAFGGNAAPYYPWLDFGGSTGRGHRPKAAGSGAIKRPFLEEGRYVYPTIKEKRDDIESQVDDLLEKVIKDADFDTKA
jgi:hypothetical protein